MTNPVRKSATGSDDDVVSEGSQPPTSSDAKPAAADIGKDFPEAATETIAALLNLIKLMGGELVLNIAGAETERFERAVRAKIEQYTSPTANAAARKSGLAFASHLVEQVLTQLRAQAEVKRSLGKPQNPRRQDANADKASPSPSISSKFLN
jgi:hypothetical protein